MNRASARLALALAALALAGCSADVSGPVSAGSDAPTASATPEPTPEPTPPPGLVIPAPGDAELFRLTVADGAVSASAGHQLSQVLGLRVVGACVSPDGPIAQMSFTPVEAASGGMDVVIPCDGTEHTAVYATGEIMSGPFSLSSAPTASGVTSGYAVLIPS
ncbi:hypothetical protein HQQ80_16310 [Microbacteriaceae bacterium VKM Ac-2855]|nr:hypothetical protein [Microbacteriaceae bacterium VKM Ac-2855]